MAVGAGLIFFGNDLVLPDLQVVPEFERLPPPLQPKHERQRTVLRANGPPLTERGRQRGLAPLPHPPKLSARSSPSPSSAHPLPPMVMTAPSAAGSFGRIDSGGHTLPELHRRLTPLPSARETCEQEGPAESFRPTWPAGSSGHLAAVDPTTLPRIYSGICRSEVSKACAKLDEIMHATALHRAERNQEERKRSRWGAARWRDAQRRHERVSRQMAQRAAEEEERCRCERLALEKEQADARWKSALNRLRMRKDASQEALERQCNDVVLRTRFHGQPNGSDLCAKVDEHSASDVEPSCTWGLDDFDNGDSSADDSDDHEVTDGSDIASPRLHVGNVDATAGDSHQMQKPHGWRSRGVPLDVHIEFLRRVKKLKNAAARSVRTHEARKMRFERLPAAEREICEAALARSGKDPYTVSLSVKGLRTSLYEVGLGGIDISEQLAVLSVCTEAWDAATRFSILPEESTDGQHRGVNIYTFGTSVMPVVRRALEAARQPRLEEAFALRDISGSGRMPVAICAEALRSVVPEYLKPSAVTIKALELLGKDVRVARDAGSPAELAKAEEAKAAEEVGLHILQQLAAHFAEETQRERAAREWRVCEELGEPDLEPEVFWRMRPDLCLLQQLFTRHGNANGRLNAVLSAPFFKNFGFEGLSQATLHVDEDGLGFKDVLRMIQQIRTKVAAEEFSDCRPQFEQLATAKEGNKDMQLSVHDLSAFLEAVDLVPRNREEQEALSHAFEDALRHAPDASAALTFAETQHSLQRAREELCRLHRERECRAAIDQGFKEKELEDLYAVFAQIDADGSGAIDIAEMWHAVTTLGFKVTKTLFEATFKKFDVDGSGELDFSEYVRLLMVIRERDDVFHADRPVRSLGELTRSEQNHVFVSLRFAEDPEDLEDAVLLQRLCEAFYLDASSPLQNRLGVKTFQELIGAAERVAAESSACIGEVFDDAVPSGSRALDDTKLLRWAADGEQGEPQD